MSRFPPISSVGCWRIVCVAVIASVAVFLRLKSFEPFQEVGFDETIYRQYVDYLGQNGVRSFPQLIERYNEEQPIAQIALLPPTRVTFLVFALGWRAVFGGATVEALRKVSAWSSIFVLFAGGLLAWRLRGLRAGCGVFALLAVAPTQLSMAHRALIDGFFGMTALFVIWSLWEALQNPGNRVVACLYGACLALMVTTKENAAFVYFAVWGILLLNRWLRFGEISRSLLVATLTGPLVGATILVLSAGGIRPLLTVYSVNAEMSVSLAYAAATGDGPWFRYLTDLLLVSPAITLFAIGGAFTIPGKDRSALYFLLFVIISYIAMANVPLGMNLRYANMWDFPLRWLALLPLLRWAEKFSSATRQRLFFYGLLLVLVLAEFANYSRIFLANEMYDPVTFQLMRALKMLR